MPSIHRLMHIIHRVAKAVALVEATTVADAGGTYYARTTKEGEAMDIAFRGKNIELTEALKRHAEKKLARFEKYFYDPVSFVVTFSVEKEQHMVEVTMQVDNGLLIRAQESSPDMYASLDTVVDKLERQIHKYKTRIYRKARKPSADDMAVVRGAAPAPDQQVLAQEDEPNLTIARYKRFPLKPMTEEEAILQMDLLGHDFYVFTNGATERVNVVYRRHDGSYGLIEPEG